MYSEPNPPFIEPVLEQMPKNMRTWLTVRDDDIYSYRWGDPDFARDYVRHMPGPDRVTGFYMGPDGYCWGREFIDLITDFPGAVTTPQELFHVLPRLSPRLYSIASSQIVHPDTVETAVRWNNAAGTTVSLARGVMAFLDPLKVRWNGIRGKYR